MPGFVSCEIAAADGFSIAARFFPPEDRAKAAILLVAAMGVSQSFYEALAAWLAAEGFLTATFDYRGIGASRRGTLRGFDATIGDWARLDCRAMLDALCERAPGIPVCWIGHSLGGQIFPLAPNRERLARVITIATGSGYWRENSPALRRVAWWLWYVVAPVSVRLFGYFPGRRLRKVGDLPRGVMQQWRRWCLNPEYAVGCEGAETRRLFASAAMPVVSISFADDEFMSALNTDSIHGLLAAAPKKMIRIAPQDIGVARIGHFGFFKPRFAATLWAKILLPELRAAIHPHQRC
jgi:predicted alpha/beta hydrolase